MEGGMAPDLDSYAFIRRDIRKKGKDGKPVSYHYQAHPCVEDDLFR